jgi:GRIP domain
LNTCTEQANREREDAVAKLNMARGLSSGSAVTGQQHSNGSSSTNGQSESPLESSEAKYAALKEEYKLYRKKAMAALQSGGGAPSAGTPRSSGNSSSNAAADSALSSSSGSSSTRGHRPHRADSFSAGSGDEAKMAYLRNLLLKYLGTDETVAKQHMERAMGAVFSFSPAELAAVKEQREKAAAAATGAWLAGVSSLLGGNKGS